MESTILSVLGATGLVLVAILIAIVITMLTTGYKALKSDVVRHDKILNRILTILAKDAAIASRNIDIISDINRLLTKHAKIDRRSIDRISSIESSIEEMNRRLCDRSTPADSSSKNIDTNQADSSSSIAQLPLFQEHGTQLDLFSDSNIASIASINKVAEQEAKQAAAVAKVEFKKQYTIFVAECKKVYDEQRYQEFIADINAAIAKVDGVVLSEEPEEIIELTSDMLVKEDGRMGDTVELTQEDLDKIIKSARANMPKQPKVCIGTTTIVKQSVPVEPFKPAEKIVAGSDVQFKEDEEVIELTELVEPGPDYAKEIKMAAAHIMEMAEKLEAPKPKPIKKEVVDAEVRYMVIDPHGRKAKLTTEIKGTEDLRIIHLKKLVKSGMYVEAEKYFKTRFPKCKLVLMAKGTITIIKPDGSAISSDLSVNNPAEELRVTRLKKMIAHNQYKEADKYFARSFPGCELSFCKQYK